MLDRDMSLLDIVARHPFFCWLRGKRARASDADSSSIQNIRGGGGGSSKRRNSPPPDPLGTADSKEWDRVLPAPVSKLVITAPVSTCSGSTLSRTASWSEATVGSESDMRTFGRLQQHSAEGAQEDQFQEKSPPPVMRVAQGSFQGVATGVCYSTTAAIPINIPCRLDKNEPNFVLQEAARQSLGEMELRMSLPSARASRRGVKLSGDEAGHARPCQRSTAVARNVHVASHPQGLVVRGEEEGREAEGRSLGSGAAAPSSFWRSTPSLGPFDGPSPSNSCGGFEGCYFGEPTPKAASNAHTLCVVEYEGDRREKDSEGGDADEDDEDSSIDSDLIFDLEP